MKRLLLLCRLYSFFVSYRNVLWIGSYNSLLLFFELLARGVHQKDYLGHYLKQSVKSVLLIHTKMALQKPLGTYTSSPSAVLRLNFTVHCIPE